MFLAPCWLGWSMVRAGRASRRTALEPGRGGGGRRGNVVHSSVSVLRSGALFQTYTAHNTSHRHQPLLYTLWVVCEVTSPVRRSGDCANKPVNSDPCVRHSGETDNLTSCVSVVIVLCTWHQQWPALKPWWRLKELWHIAAELQLEKTEPKQWRREDSSSYEEEWREQWMSSLKGGVKNVLQPHHCLEIEARLAI